MIKKIVPFIKQLISPAGFYILFFSYFFGYFIVFRFFLIGLKLFDMEAFVFDNVFASLEIYYLFIISTVIFQLAILILYLVNFYKNQNNINKILRFSIFPFILFLIISLVGADNIYFKYFQFFVFSFNLAFITFLLFGDFIKKDLDVRKSKYFIWAIIIFFCILYITTSIIRHNHYGSHAYDLGIFSQVVYNYSTIGYGDSSIRGFTNIFADHFSPILVFLAPLYWLWANAKMLLIIQGITVALGAWPLYLIVQRKLKSNLLPLIICLAYLLFAGIWQAISFDFHEIVFFPVLFLSAFYFLDKKKYVFYWIFFALALLVKEDVAIYFLFFSIYQIFFKKEYKTGIITILISIGWYLMATGYIIPYFLQKPFWYFHFSHIGQNTFDALKNALTNPLFIYNQAVNASVKIETILGLFGSFGYLGFFALIFIFLSLPMLAEQVLFDVDSHWAIGFHYSIAIAPILVLGAVYGSKKISELLKQYFPKTDLQKVLVMFALLILFSSLIESINYKSAYLNLFKKSYYEKQEWMRNIDEVIENIPKDASVITQHNIVSHLSERRLIAPYPNYRSADRIPEPDYYIFSIRGYTFPSSGEQEQIDIIEGFLNNEKYGLYKRVGDAFVFRKNYQDSELEQEAKKYLENLKKSF